ncbi:UDP-N-acetylmuramoyl-L-alanine--D-glutamate ligase [Minwuia sp.]|uniref:UDP-N-acetylmuramoyl-L-alanine--D-glutamate ligase n=1 Tax=Minwuia sp. TaxID=2493630 RepID=UPI003A8ECA35
MIPLAPYRDRRLAVLGLGKSGVATAKAAIAGGVEVLAWDDRPERRAALPNVPMQNPVELDWTTTDILVPAPGIPLTHPQPHPAMVAARAAGASIAGDVELYATACPDSIKVGVTGTNGKSTTTALIAHVLQASGRDAVAAGNIGRAVLDLDPPKADTVHVLELSSYQLDLIDSFHPQIGVFLNLTPDHLDRHGGMDGYMAAKERLFANMSAGDTAVIGVDDPYGSGLADRLDTETGITVVRVSVERALQQGIYALKGHIFENGLSVVDLKDARALPGTHNHQNAAAAYAVCRALGCTPPQIAAALGSFPGLAHRIERIGETGGVTFYNDSKATNAEAAARALGAFEHIHWIAGGKPKDGGLDAVMPFMNRVRHAYLIGEAMGPFARALDGIVETSRCNTLAAATEAAFDAARREGTGVVLLSPACASFDQFPNFEARGDAFRAIAEYIIAREGGAS